MTLRVSEIFYSIQGESTDTGRPCAFVRLSGCNLRCAYCDTTYAWEDGAETEVGQILGQVADWGCRLVEITGGEPLLQPETPELIRRLLTGGYRVLVETNGSIDISGVDRRCTRIVDIKCPSSNEADRMDFGNLSRLAGPDQVKFVMADRADYEYAKRVIASRPLAIPGSQVLVSPVADRLAPQELAGWILADRLDVRLQLQMHKILWPETERGV